MSIEPFHPELLTIPETPYVVTPKAFWDELIGYREPSLIKLTLRDRDRINRDTLAKAAEILDSDLTRTRVRTRGMAFALHKAMERTKEYKRYWVDCATWDREQALAMNRRVPCGARKKDGSQCRAMTEPGRNRCRFHGGRSTGPRTLAGMRKALSCLPQYRNDPERLNAKLAELQDGLAV